MLFLLRSFMVILLAVSSVTTVMAKPPNQSAATTSAKASINDMVSQGLITQEQGNQILSTARDPNASLNTVLDQAVQSNIISSSQAAGLKNGYTPTRGSSVAANNDPGGSVDAGPVTLDNPDASSMLDNITKAIPNLMELVTAIAYVLGIYMVIRAVVELKHFGEGRSMMSAERHSFKTPAVYFLVGAALLYLPTTVRTGMSTFWTDFNPYAYNVGGASSDKWCSIVQDMLIISQLVGTIALIRGLVLLTQTAGHSAQPGTFAKAITFIIAGIFCIDMFDFINMMLSTMGMSARWCFS